MVPSYSILQPGLDWAQRPRQALLLFISLPHHLCAEFSTFKRQHYITKKNGVTYSLITGQNYDTELFVTDMPAFYLRRNTGNIRLSTYDKQ